MPVTPSEIMLSKIWAKGLVILVAAVLSMKLVVQFWLQAPIAGSVAQSRFFVDEPSDQGDTEMKLLLSQITTKQLQRLGALRGVSGSTLAAKLLVTIIRNGLYEPCLMNIYRCARLSGDWVFRWGLIPLKAAHLHQSLIRIHPKKQHRRLGRRHDED
jgi:hypothetical protein